MVVSFSAVVIFLRIRVGVSFSVDEDETFLRTTRMGIVSIIFSNCNRRLMVVSFSAAPSNLGKQSTVIMKNNMITTREGHRWMMEMV